MVDSNDMTLRERLKDSKRIVVKIGTSSLTYDNGHINMFRIGHLSRVLCDLVNQGREVILVSSGAIGVGVPGICDPKTGVIPFCTNLGWHDIPFVEEMKKHLDTRNAEKIGQLEHRYEEDVRRVRVASYVTDPYLLKSSDMEFIYSAINHIDANLVNPQFSVEALAAMMSMTRANLHLKVKNVTGISPVELIRKIRIEAACRMIREGKYTLTEIAEKTGFNSTSYFTVTFKKVAGCTPSEYLTKSKNL